MALFPTSDLLEHLRLDAVITAEHTTHVEYRADLARGIRKQAVEKKWYRERCIGSGAFGDVWLEVTREDDPVSRRAVKTIRKNRLSGVDFEKELLALSKFSKAQHQREQVLVNFFGWFESSSMLYLSLEYFELGDLEKHINESITEDDIKVITIDVLNGLRIMHSEHFAHRDLKPSNIFVVQKPPASNWWVKIGDFGISKRIQSDVTALRTQTGTPAYQAPEVSGYLDTDEPTSVYNNAVDMWSLGCVIYKIATQNVPFPDPRMVLKYCSGKIPFPQQSLLRKMSPEGVEFVESLIVPEPRARPSAVNALEAVWLLQERSRTSIFPTELPMRFAQTAPQVIDPKLPIIGRKAPYPNEPAPAALHSPGDSLHDADKIMNRRSSNNGSLLQSSSIGVVGDEVIRPNQTPKALGSSSFGQLLASCSNDRTVRLWDPVTGKLLKILKGHESYVATVAFSQDRQLLASGSADKTVRLWNPVTGELLKILRDHEDGVSAVAFSQDGQLLGTGSGDKTVRLWDPTNGELLRTLEGHESSVRHVAFSPDSQLLASGSYDRTVRLWNPVNGELLKTLEGHESSVWAVAFSPDSKLLASASDDKTVRLWDPTNGELLRTLEGNESYVRHVAFSPDNQLLASSDHKTVRLWNPVNGELLKTLKGHESLVWGVAFSPDSQLLASGSDDATINVWNPVKGELLRTLKGHQSWIWAVTFSPDSQLLNLDSAYKTVGL